MSIELMCDQFDQKEHFDDIYYLSYGSNLNQEQMKNRCSDARVLGKVIMPGFRLIFRGVADFCQDKNSDLCLGVWKISRNDEERLDEYEGVRGGLYRKIYWTMSINSKKIPALIYQMNRSNINLPADSYLETIKNGFEDFRFDLNFLEESLVYTKKNTKGNSYIKKSNRRKQL